MNSKGQHCLSVDPRRRNRRAARLLLEPLESRALLSTVSAVGVMTPAATVIAPDRRGGGGGGGGFGGGGGGGVTNPSPASTALTPAQISSAYSLSKTFTGTGTTIAIVTAYNDPNIAADLTLFDTKYGLATASLSVVNEAGQGTNLPYLTDSGWSLETAMDVEWAHAAAPGARIVLVEANSANTTDLMSAVQTAGNLANVVSMSWGGSEFSGQTAYDKVAYFAKANVTFVAASGDSGGATGASWPASSPYVVGVGGTTLTLSSTGYGSETAWSASGSPWYGYSGSGGGVSTIEALPSYQTALGSSYATGRATPDVSLNANPNTGLAVYSSVNYSGQSGWFQVGGTSAGTPIWAGLVAAADSARAANHLPVLSSAQTLNLLYGTYGSASAYAATFHDITSGSNFVARAVVGYDMVTGLGSPRASNLIAEAATYVAPSTLLKTAAVVFTSPATGTSHNVAAVAQTLTAPSTTTINPIDGVVIPIAPVTGAIGFALPVTSQPTAVPASATLGNTPVASTLPRQPLPRSNSLSSIALSHDEPLLPPAPVPANQPGLFLDPVEMEEVGDEAPAVAVQPRSSDPSRAEAVDSVLDEGWTLTPDLPPPSAPATTLETDEPAPTTTKAALAGLAVALWGTWTLRRQESDRDHRRPRLVLPTF
jgi:hypothetical protein